MAYPLGSHPFDLKVSNLGKNKEKQLKKTHVIQINGLSTSHTQEFHHLHTNIHIYTLHMAGPILMDLITPHPCPSSILMTYWGEPSSYLWMRMGRERGLPFLRMSRISVNNKSLKRRSAQIQAQD